MYESGFWGLILGWMKNSTGVLQFNHLKNHMGQDLYGDLYRTDEDTEVGNFPESVTGRHLHSLRLVSETHKLLW